ncbi:hypothetical protein D3C78_726880 [compost metagenome]
MPAVLIDMTQGGDFLGIQAEAVFLQRHVQTLHPGHLAEAQGQFRVIRMIDLDPVPTLFLGHVARHVGSTQRGFERRRVLRDMDQPDTDSGHERPAFPDKMQILHRLAQAFGNFLRRFRCAVFQQDAELVAAKARQGVAFAQPRLQQRADVPQQFVPRRVAAGVVDQLELVQIEEHQGMATRMAGQVVQRLFQAIFELATVGKAGQGIVGRLPRQIGDVLPLLGHVMQHQHRPADFSGIADGRAHQRDRHRAAVQALNQLGVFTAATELAAQNMLDQGETIGLGIFVQQVEQRRQRQSRRLLGLPVGHRLGRRVHVGDCTGNIRGDHPITN